MSASTEVPSKTTVLTGRQIVLAAAASVFGWGLDLFDLLILLYVAPIIGRLFFPAGNPMLSLAATYASFAVTLLMRPLGSAIFGTYADRNGRRKALIVAVVGRRHHCDLRRTADGGDDRLGRIARLRLLPSRCFRAYGSWRRSRSSRRSGAGHLCRGRRRVLAHDRHGVRPRVPTGPDLGHRLVRRRF